MSELTLTNLRLVILRERKLTNGLRLALHNIFPNIPVSTLRLRGKSSLAGVNNHVEGESRFDSGPVYAIVGIRKFDYGKNKD
uniref:Transcriptional regulator n=1 Tax=Elaeophora elaphi TaxID=1147741 RepID=A0A0R3RNR6_9BILA